MTELPDLVTDYTIAYAGKHRREPTSLWQRLARWLPTHGRGDHRAWRGNR